MIKNKTSKKVIILLISFSLFFIVLGVVICYNSYKFNKELSEFEKSVRLYRPINIEVYDSKKISELFFAEPIKIVFEEKIRTSSLGEKKVKIKYLYKNRKITRFLKINVVDTTSPIIFGKSSYSVKKGSSINFLNSIISADNYDNNPKRYINGEYNLEEVGSYNVKYYIEDSSGNSNEKDIVIKVYEDKQSKNSSTSASPKLKKFSNFYKEYKSNTNKIGIDVSKWQGEIDFKKVSEAGCEFVIIRMGYQNGLKGELVLDKYFEQNIKNAVASGLKVGVYLYTYAGSKNEALGQAKWVVNNIKHYKIDIGVVYDWESWSNYNELNLSIHGFNEVARTFIDYIDDKGYKGYLYSSKFYLENIWDKSYKNVWLAHYTDKTDYFGKYNIWQISNNGGIDGIKTAVDIDILYE